MIARPLLAACALASVTLAAPEPAVLLRDDFTGGALAPTWEPVRVHDTRADTIAARDGQLVLGLDTLEADDATVKLRGVRSQRVFTLGAGERLRVCATLDWNEQVNGSYLTAGLALLPEPAVDDAPAEPAPLGLPHAAPEALAFEFVGVPPGRNARPFLWRRQAAGLRPLYTEGWPQPRREDRVGRPVGRVQLELEVRAETVVLREDGRERFRGPGGLSGRLRLWLFVTGHSNYPPRSVVFDDVRVEKDRDEAPR